jgi:hypothetical protein
MKRTYNIGDIITLRGKQYEVRSQREFDGEATSYCRQCAFSDGMYCILRSYYDHFLIDCREKGVYFKRI